MVKNLLKTDEMSYAEAPQESTRLVSRNRLCRRLERGPEVRAKFVESHINKGLAYQMRAMREARGWSQEELARRVDMPQTAISRLESPNYGKPTTTTLKRMAKIYDVALVVRFVPFSKLMDWVSGTSFIDEGLSSDAMAVPSFGEELQSGTLEAPTQTISPMLVSPMNTETRVFYANYAAPRGNFLDYGIPVNTTVTDVAWNNWRPPQGNLFNEERPVNTNPILTTGLDWAFTMRPQTTYGEEFHA
jgi:transcriptional regulator with XRE-family HTH domain